MSYYVNFQIIFDREDPTGAYYRIGDDIKYSVTVEVRDNNGEINRFLSTYCSFYVTLEDINNKAPVFDNDDDFLNLPPFIQADPNVGDNLFRAFAFDRDIGLNGEVQYELRNLNCEDCLMIDPSTGYVSAKNALPSYAVSMLDGFYVEYSKIIHVII